MMPITMSADGTTMQQGDEKLIVRFYLMEHLNEERTKAEGINKYDNWEMVEIIIPGCRDNCIRRASDQDKQRFRRQYEAFLATKSDGEVGTPLSHFPFISPAERKELEYFNIYTGENLINIQDVYLDRISLDVRTMALKVKAFMDVAKDTAASVKYAEENEALRREMNLVQEQMKKLLMNAEKDKLNGDQKIELRNDVSVKGHDEGQVKQSHKRGRPKSINEDDEAFVE
jgi:hypothetical protein